MDEKKIQFATSKVVKWILLLLVSFVNTLLANTVSLHLFGTPVLTVGFTPIITFSSFKKTFFKLKNGFIFKVRLFKPRKSYSESCNSFYSNILILIHFFSFRCTKPGKLLFALVSPS